MTWPRWEDINLTRILKQVTHRPDAPVAQVVDIVIVSKAVLQVHIIVDGGNNILLGDMFLWTRTIPWQS